MSDVSDARGDEMLDQIRTAMRGYDWRLEAVLTFTHGVAVQVYAKAEGSKRYATVGPMIFPPPGGSLADTLRMLGDLSTASEATP